MIETRLWSVLLIEVFAALSYSIENHIKPVGVVLKVVERVVYERRTGRGTRRCGELVVHCFTTEGKDYKKRGRNVVGVMVGVALRTEWSRNLNIRV